MRIWTEEDDRFMKLLDPWIQKDPDPDLKNSPEEVQKLLEEYRKLSWKIRLENG